MSTVEQKESSAQDREPWFKRRIEPFFDGSLRIVEFLTVIGIAIVILLVAFSEGYWILWGALGSDRQSRLQSVLSLLNGNWKIGLLLLIPLFYRTIRAFLERAEEFAGIKAPREALAMGRAKPNPQPEPQAKEKTT